MISKDPASSAPAHVLVTTGDLCGECPVWDAEAQRLWWTDCVGLKLHAYDWRSRKYHLVREGLEVYGFRRNRPGGFVITNTTGVWLWDGEGAPRLVAGEVDGSRLQLNDCCADSRGRLITASFFYNPTSDYEFGKLIGIDPDGRPHVLDDGYQLANGIGLSPDERTLYVTDTIARRIQAYDYDLPSGSASHRRTLVQVPGEEGIPDGLAVDADGFLWSAQWYGACVVRYDPAGCVERRIALPAKQISSLAFGGPDLTDIFLTSAAQSERLPVMPPGYDPDSGLLGGALYHMNLGIAGREQRPALIRISD